MESNARRVPGPAWREFCLGGEAKACGAAVVDRGEGEPRRARGWQWRVWRVFKANDGHGPAWSCRMGGYP